MKIHVALRDQSVKTSMQAGAGISCWGRVAIWKRMPREGATFGQTHYMSVNMHPIKMTMRLRYAVRFVPGLVND
jgi:hypothetical protein